MTIAPLADTQRNEILSSVFRHGGDGSQARELGSKSLSLTLQFEDTFFALFDQQAFERRKSRPNSSGRQPPNVRVSALGLD